MSDPNGITVGLATGHQVTLRPAVDKRGLVEICAQGAIAGYLPNTAIIVMTLAEAQSVRDHLTNIIVNKGGS
jgi:hypothetical protein